MRLIFQRFGSVHFFADLPAFSFIKTYEKQLLDELHSDSFDSYTDALSPAFRLYHLTRAKF
jgi:hypothetical protein